MRINGREVFALFVLTLLMSSLGFVQISLQQSSDIAYIEPSIIYTSVYENFTIVVIANVSVDIWLFHFELIFDPTQMSILNVTILPPWGLLAEPIVGVGYVWVGGIGPFTGPGSIPLAEITFHCEASGISDLLFDYVEVEDASGFIRLPWQGAIVQQWYFKAPYEDYAPSGVPDFDQRQDNWTNPVTGTWTWCGPLAAANSLWWFDSKFEPNPAPHGTINDGFPLVQAYGAWDDHDLKNVEPFVNDLAWFMDTDGQRTKLNHSGTNVHDMEAGISQYLQKVGLNPLGDANGDGIVDDSDRVIVENANGSTPGMATWDMAADLNGDNQVDALDLTMVLDHLGETWGKFYEKTVKMPTFEYIEEEVEKSEDVVILLGFWQDQDGIWVRVGGHFVTVPGVNSATFTIAFSDPIKNNAELGFPGRVLPHPHPHNPAPPFSTHNNASYVSHDYYGFSPTPSPGGSWGPEGYEVEDIVENFIDQNIPKEFEEWTDPYKPGWPMFAEVEYAVVVSPIRDVAITNKTLEKTVIGQNYPIDINVTVANEGGFTETFNVTTYYNATSFSEGFETGTFTGWDFYYSTNGAQSGSVSPGMWNSSIVTGAAALSGTYSARLFADAYAHAAPYRVDAVINRTINRACASTLRATLKFDDIQGFDGLGHSSFAIDVLNALNTSKRVLYGFSTTGDFGDVNYTISPGELVNFERNIVADYYNKYNESLPNQIMVRLTSSADYAEGIPARRTTDVRLDDISIVLLRTPIDIKTVTLTSGNSTFIVFTWNTAGICKGNYTITAFAQTVSGETDITDNTLVDGRVLVTIPGDVDGDRDVDIFDIVTMAGGYSSKKGSPRYDSNSDVDGDGDIDIFDIVIAAGNYNKSW